MWGEDSEVPPVWPHAARSHLPSARSSPLPSTLPQDPRPRRMNITRPSGLSPNTSQVGGPQLPLCLPAMGPVSRRSWGQGLSFPLTKCLGHKVKELSKGGQHGQRVGSWWGICPRVASCSVQWALGAVTRTPGSQRNVSWGAVRALLLRAVGFPAFIAFVGPHPTCPCRFCSRPSELSTQQDMAGFGDNPVM